MREQRSAPTNGEKKVQEARISHEKKKKRQ